MIIAVFMFLYVYIVAEFLSCINIHQKINSKSKILNLLGQPKIGLFALSLCHIEIIFTTYAKYSEKLTFLTP